MSIPDYLPVLSHGAHATPADGACLMEYVSLLAGERWSDHPACTHPVLAEMARTVNDLLDDSERHRLVPLIHRLPGTAPTGTGQEQRRLNVRLAVWCARQVLPQVRAQDRAVCEAAIVAAEVWADNPTPATANAAYAAYAAAYAANAAAEAADDLVGLLTGLLDEHDRLTGHTPAPISPDDLAALAHAAGVPA